MRIEKNYDIYFKGKPITGIWASGKDVLISFGLKAHIKRNIHFTIYFSNEDKTLNTHITDTEKTPKKVWEKIVPINELFPIVNKFIKDSFKRYYWFNYYWILNDELKESLGFSLKSKDYFENNIDIANIFEVVSKKDALTKIRIRKGYSNNKFRPGFQFKQNNTFLVVPLSNNCMLKQNTDVRKTPLIQLPTIEGMYKYFEYLESEHIFEQMEEFSEENIEKMRNVLISSLLYKPHY